MRIAQNLFIAAVLLLMLGDGIPAYTSWQRSLKRALDPVADWTGLWQGSWKLFAPNVDRVNIGVRAEILYADGTQETWESPDWARLSFARRFTRYREGRYVDKVRLDTNRAAWSGLARYIARTHPHPHDPTIPVTVVRLVRHWGETPPPSGSDWQPVEPSPHDHSYQFYTETFR